MNQAQFPEIKKILDVGEVIACPTETVYGLGADPFQRLAVEKMMALKGRPLHQSPLLLIPNRDWLYRLTRNVSLFQERLIHAFWPGPLTIVFEASQNVPSWLIRDDETVALRLSPHEWIKAFLNYYQKPMVSTSANISGQPSADSFEAAKEYFPSGVAYFVDGGCLKPSKGSTIVSLSGASIYLIREGDISLAELKKI